MTRLPSSPTSPIGKPSRARPGHVLVAGIGEIAAGDLAGAFQQMPGDGALPQQIPVVHRPAEGMDHRRQEQRRIGRAAGDDDIGARRQRLRHRFGAEIGIGGQEPVAELPDRAVELHDLEVAVLAGIEHVVADDGGDLQRGQPERLRDVGGLARRRFRVGGAHVGDDLDAFGGAERQHRAHPLFEQRVIAAVRIFHPRLLCQRHRAFAEALEHEVLDVALFGEFDRGLDAIARIAGPGAYSNGSHLVSITVTGTSCFAVRNTLARKIAGIQAHSSAGMQPCGLTAAGPLTGNGQMSHQDRNKRPRRPFPKENSRYGGARAR